MQTYYTVTIRKEHCEGRVYVDCTDCPLCAAIREQLPEFDLHSVGGITIHDTKGRLFYFNTSADDPNYGWCGYTMRRIISGEIPECRLTFYGPKKQGG